MTRTTVLRITVAALTAAALGGISTPALAVDASAPALAVDASAPAASAPGRLMLVMDASGSMAEPLAAGGTKIAAARSALHELTGTLPDAQQVGLRVFGATRSKSSGSACTDSQRVVDLASGDRGALDRAIDAVKPFGETPIGYALQQAGKDLGTSGQRTVVLVSDGEPTCSPDPCPVAAALAAQGVATRVDVVGLAVSGAARAKLRCIADRGDGRYYDADSAADLSNALEAVAVRAALPIRTSGTPITGTNTRVNAPLAKSGDHLTTLGGVGGDHQTTYFTVHRAQTDSTLHVSIDTPLTAESDTIGLTLLDSEGRQCAWDTGYGTGSLDTDAIIAASVAIPRSRDASDLHCAAAGDFVVQIDHGYHDSTATGRRADIPVELRIREEPPVPGVESLPETAETPVYTDPDMSGTVTRTVGGDSLNAATVLTPGAYSGVLATGDTQVFAVDLDYGQSLASAVRVSVSPTLAQQLSSGGWPTLSMRLLSPSRADADGGYAFRTDASDHAVRYSTIYQGSDGRVVYDYTNTVNYRNRFGTSDELRGSSEAGRYLVVVSLLDRDGSGKRNAVPFTMGIAVRGEPSNRPAYAAGATASATTQPEEPQQGSSTSTATTAAKPHDAIGPFDLAGATVGAGAIGLGIVVVLAGLAVLAIVLIRRGTRPTDQP